MASGMNTVFTEIKDAIMTDAMKVAVENQIIINRLKKILAAVCSVSFVIISCLVWILCRR